MLDLRTTANDQDHVVALFTERGRWGAVSKTNHAVLRWREPVYTSVRELAASYFHEYFLDNGKKTLREYSRPFDLSSKKYSGWTVAEEHLWHISEALDNSLHYMFLPRGFARHLRRADPIERKAGMIVEWKPWKR